MKTLADLTEAAVPVRKELEADLQERCVRWARERGYWARKFSSISQRSVPDYLFAKEFTGFERMDIRDCGLTIKFFTEFKRPGTKPKLIEKYFVIVMSTEAQYEEQLAMREAGWDGFENDDFEAFKNAVYKLEKDALTH